MYRLASAGLITPPCGVPRSLSLPPVNRRFPFPSRSSTGTFNHILIRCSMYRSTILRATHCSSSECGMVSKYFDKSASTLDGAAQNGRGELAEGGQHGIDVRDIEARQQTPQQIAEGLAHGAARYIGFSHQGDGLVGER